MTEELFREDATLLQCDAQVLAVDEWPDGSRAVVLDRTVFYPLGGGQAGDAGVLVLADGRELPVADTRKHKDRPGAIAHVLAAGAEVTGVIPSALMDSEVGHTRLTKLHVVKDMHERKAMMADLADGFVALPGGIGTLEELFEVMTWLQLGYHSKPVGLLNSQGFYDDLLRFMDKQRESGFLKPAHHALLITDSNIATLLDRMMAFNMPEGVSVFSRRAASTLGP
jgi:uncharacterized protein (TIGR00730 family)